MFQLLLMTILLTPVFAGAGASADPFDPFANTCIDSSGNAIDSTVCKEKDAQQTAGENPLTGDEGTITAVANLIAFFTAIVAVIIIIVAGITMVLSSGDSAKIKSSRDAIIYAAIGLVVIALARTIVVFVINRV